MKSRGFSIVELTVVIVIISILLVLGMVSFNNYQANARDKQREVRAENIARYIDSLYSSGSTNPTISKGTYPSTSLVTTTSASTSIDQTKLLSLFGKNGFDIGNLKSAGKDSYGFAVDQTTAQPTSISPDQYIYQPITLSSTGLVACVDGTLQCRSFNLYYKTESDNVVHKITSQHQ